MTLEDLESRLWYSPEKGEWRRFAVKGGNTISSIAGYKHRTGYIYIGVCSRYYAAHRLAWFYMTGEWPSRHIDHVNGDPSDNRWENLRLCTVSQNSQNRRRAIVNKTGYKGVSIHRETGKFRARIFLGRRVSKSLGLYATAHEASLAYEKAAKELFGMFARVH
jgi:hypothetical protein